jgi:hypothetical protein
LLIGHWCTVGVENRTVVWSRDSLFMASTVAPTW